MFCIRHLKSTYLHYHTHLDTTLNLVYFPKQPLSAMRMTSFEDQAMVVTNEMRGSRNFHVIFMSLSVVTYIMIIALNGCFGEVEALIRSLINHTYSL